ncbi:hypothetical protein CRM22_006603 [Opisthorchis felineus]|uniref:DNA-directed RNA polymerase subunit n=1 Tax=Opisthorchis felineus TaxID=147828 RepID=A0A4S2LRL6_OPIFE|nr:hypothetical protein CRM22_006603 [Opisthorchis felineus]
MFSSTDGQFERLGFRFYNRDDIRLLSVRQVTNELAFDKFTGRGVDGGLHDASMGVHSEKDLCGHCGLDFFACPGHFGHIEFSKPVFNPLFFDLLFKLMKAFCFGCFRIYSVDYLAAALHHLGAAASTLPGKPKQTELAELEGLPETELTKIALRSLSSRPRVPCKLCCTRSWVLRHINKQQLVMRPVSENARSRSTASEMKTNEEEESIEDFLASAAVQDPRLAPTLAALADGENQSFFVEPMERKTCSDTNQSQEQLLEEARKQLNEMSKSSVNSKETCLLPETARLFLRCLWTNDASLLRLLFPMLNSAAISHEFATDVFFMDAVLLSPSICRLPRYVGGLAFEHPETAVYSRVVRRAQCLSHIVDFIEQRQQQAQLEQTDRDNAFQQSLADLSTDPDASLVNLNDATRVEGALKLACILLQAAVNGLYDMNAATIPTGLDSKVGGIGKSVVRLPGLRQRLEKKEGLFRMHIMGKRVNYACRSVISPDPILDVTEVGVPLFFATRLTFPTPVNMHNLAQMRHLVSNGPEVYPGARSVQTPEGQLIHLPRGNTAQAKRRRETLACCLTPVSSTSTGIPFVVNRHVLQGDMLVMNRQPTLHKPSMQAHRVRIIHSTAAKTLRMHYSNCRAYNADFDGDEMNGHLVQSYAALAELESLASVPSHYLGPKDGAPLAGLIQDHVISAVKLTMRDRFFDQSDYLDLVYHALRPMFDAAKYACTGPPTLVTLPPAIMWPKRLWTGKQVVSTLLINLTPPDLPYINCTLRGRRTKAELWSGVSPGQATPLSDVDVVVCDGYLVSGMLDKAHIGSSSGGLIHCVHELHGPKTAAHLLNGISLLANRLLKFTAFTMGIKDMLLSDDANEERSRRFVQLRDLGLCAFADAFELDPNSLTEHEVRRLYRQAQFAPSTDQVLSKRILQLDNAMKNRLKRAQDAVCDSAIPSGLYVGFPENNLQLMVHVGAKGGMVNAQQMSVALGQIELEGRRVPLMLSGRSLPSFPPYDVRPRAGGMCTHRFLTSLPPQELFFHSMAGRDGLVDTAVKTSRSGYLQRSAIKHLEDLSIQYDGTVRDSGNNVIQFHYGDDGVDVCQASFLQSAGLHLFADNAALLSMRWYSSNGLNHSIGHQHLLGPNALPRPLQQIADQVGTERQMLLMKSPSEHKIVKLFRKARRAERSFTETAKQQKQLSAMEILNADLPDPPCVVASALRELCLAKLISAQVPPGEPVGLLAAQSVGEPSTQMTLNTFHFAGRGEMNVTLGIPRLREILMSGSPHISTPCMEVPVRSTNEARRRCNRVAKRMYKLKLLEAIHFPIGETVDYASDSCTLEIRLQPASAYSERSHVRPSRVLRFLERILFPDLAKRLDRELKDQGKTTLIRSFALTALARQQQTGRAGAEGPGAADEDEESAEREGGAWKSSRARDEWNEDDGHEAIRRRRLEAEAEEGAPMGRDQVIDLDEVVELKLDDDEDDEAAELRELGMDPERLKEDDGNSDKDENDQWDVDEIKTGTNQNGMERGKTETKSMDPATWDGSLQAAVMDDQDEQELVPDYEAKVDEEDEEFELESRRTFVTRLHARFTKYDFDRSDPPKWARLTICMFDPKEGRISIDLKSLITRIVNKSVVSSVPGIEKVIVDRSNPSEWIFRVEGINMAEIMQYPAVFDLNRLYTNNIAIMSQTYGIEAARAAIQKEVSGVFGHYGIYVDSRHLSLIADYMTKSGSYRAFNRSAFIGHPSPLQQMSFETVTSSLKSTIQETVQWKKKSGHKRVRRNTYTSNRSTRQPRQKLTERTLLWRHTLQHLEPDAEEVTGTSSCKADHTDGIQTLRRPFCFHLPGHVLPFSRSRG